MSNAALEAAMAEVKLDMTPMIDCVFLMIIFFVCIDFRVLEAKLPAYLPKDKGSHSTRVEPQEQLTIGVYEAVAGTRHYPEGGPGLINENTRRPYRFWVKGQSARWTVGPTPVASADDLLAELKRIMANKATWQRDKDRPGQLKPMPVVIELHPGTYANDATITADAVRAAGFQEINFGGGRGPAPARK